MVKSRWLIIQEEPPTNEPENPGYPFTNENYNKVNHLVATQMPLKPDRSCHRSLDLMVMVITEVLNHLMIESRLGRTFKRFGKNILTL